METKNCILDKDAIGRKLKRMALEIAEQNTDESEILIAGIAGNGTVVAASLVRALSQVTTCAIHQITINLNKKDPLMVSFDQSIPFENKVIIIVDDVANTGRTMLYALKPFLQAHPKKIQTLVLVERSHKLFPIQTDYVGLSITTTLQEHIAVETEGDEITGAWLY
jgi:pyrimidine operon attenuation protein / uracil phosphoribosyltransferase